LIPPTEDPRPSLSLPRTAAAPRTPAGALKRALFGIAPEETSFARRGFRGGTAEIRERLEGVGRGFVAGYHAALEERGPEALAGRIDAELERERRGFAYEGAGMALALLDTVTPGRRDRLARFLAGPGDPHTYLIHVGAGWVLARLPLSVERLLARFDPVLGWLALDGYGFHEGFFRWPKSVGRREVPRKVRGYARRGFDQGLGRSLWFVEGADVERIPRTVATFPASRQGDLWAGVGLACAYAGGPGRGQIEALLRSSGEHAPGLAQGIAFAAEARHKAGNLAPHTELACETVWGRSAREVAELTLQLSGGLPAGRPEEPAYEVWRRRIQDAFTKGA